MKLNIALGNFMLPLAKQKLSFQMTNRFHTTYIALFTMIAAILVLSIGRTALAAEEGLASSSTLIVRENNPTDRPIYANTGEVVNINGTITRNTNVLLNVELSLRSNTSQAGKEWILLDQQPGKNFTLSEPVTEYQLKVQFLNEGSYYLRPWVRITGSPNATLTQGPIDADSPSCQQCAGLGTIVVVSGKGGENGNNNNAEDRFFGTSILPYVGMAIAMGGVAAAALYISKTRKSRQRRNNNSPDSEH